MFQKIVLELQPSSFDVVRAAIEIYHHSLHQAEVFDHDMTITKKEIKRQLIVLHRLRHEFDQLLPPLEGYFESAHIPTIRVDRS